MIKKEDFQLVLLTVAQPILLMLQYHFIQMALKSNLHPDLQPTSEKKRASLFCKFISPSRSASKQLALREVSASTPPRSARSPFLALREVQVRSARGAGSLCARCRFALRKVQVHSTQGTRSLWARCRVALREVQGRPGRGEGLRCARVRVALGEVQGRFWRGAGSLCASRHL